MGYRYRSHSFFLLHPFPISHYCSTPVSPIPFPTPGMGCAVHTENATRDGTVLSSAPLNSYRSFAGNLLGCPRCPKRQPVAEVGGDQIHLVRTISKVGGDASHGSHGVVAPRHWSQSRRRRKEKATVGRICGKGKFQAWSERARGFWVEARE